LQDDRLVLTVSDTGIGLPVGLGYQSAQSLGLQLVDTLVGQLAVCRSENGYQLC
jgi:two-component sensor histidine kinase